jgi:hypothetical protein
MGHNKRAQSAKTGTLLATGGNRASLNPGPQDLWFLYGGTPFTDRGSK